MKIMIALAFMALCGCGTELGPCDPEVVCEGAARTAVEGTTMRCWCDNPGTQLTYNPEIASCAIAHEEWLRFVARGCGL